MPSTRFSAPQTLLFDADDTLWENNIYFEQAIAAFISFLDHKTHSPEEVREHLNRCERVTIAEHGYGLQSFRRSLVRCFEDLAGGQVSAEQHGRIDGFAGLVAGAELQLLTDVPETLHRLGASHRLMLVTKGDPMEQHEKLLRSGLGHIFQAVEVLAEKDLDAYRALAERHSYELASTWMIGNSPRSDINPALAAGFNAVSIPHASTWVLEQESLQPPQTGRHLVQLARFRELLLWF